MSVDIHAPGSGDVSEQLQPYDAARNRRFIAEAWGGIKMGLPLDLLFKPWLVRQMSEQADRFHR